MRRREVLAGAIALASVRPMRALAQSAVPRPLVAYLSINTQDRRAEQIDQFVDAMKKLGWVEGKNYAVEFRSTEGVNDLLPKLTQELLALKPDVFVGEGTRGAIAAAQATSTVPIVGPSMGESTVIELAGSNFARPKRNVTGILFLAASNITKEFELAAEILPSARLFAYLNDTFVANDLNTVEVQKAVAALRGTLISVDAVVPADMARAVQDCVRERADVVIVGNGALFGSEERRLTGLMADAGLPAVYPRSSSVRAGGLAAYGFDAPYSYRRAADFADRILKGAKPGDLPVEVPNPVLAINLVTAKALGLTIPPSVRFRSDIVIE